MRSLVVEVQGRVTSVLKTQDGNLHVGLQGQGWRCQCQWNDARSSILRATLAVGDFVTVETDTFRRMKNGPDYLKTMTNGHVTKVERPDGSWKLASGSLILNQHRKSQRRLFP